MTKTVFKSMHNWQRNPSSNWYKIDQKNAVLILAVCCGAIWRHREKLQHRCATTVHPVYNCSKIFLENLLPVGLLVTQTCSFRAIFGLPIWSLTLAVSARQRHAENFLYRCTSIYSLGPKLPRWNFLQISQLSIRSGAHKLFRRLFYFSQFLTCIYY